MKETPPPFLLNGLLFLVLSPHDRETVSGDLYEEFSEAKLPELGRFRASLWYMRQVVSFLPAKASAVILQGPALRVFCLGTALAGLWLGMMDMLLRHPGYLAQSGIAAMIVCQALVTLGALWSHNKKRGLRAVAMMGSLGLLWLAGSALKATFDGAHFEGYVLLIALALLTQAGLTLLTLSRMRVAGGKGA